MMRGTLATLGTLLLVTVPSVMADDITIGGVPYVQSGQCETVDATFLTPDGGITAGQYSGFVTTTVHGGGESFFQYLNDAFYVYTDNGHNPIVPYHQPDHYQLTESETTLVRFGEPGYDTQQVYHKIFFDVDAGIEVAPDHTPAYRPDHTYSVVIATAGLGDGTGMFAPDFKDEHDGGRGVLVRAERQGRGNGRIYIGEITATNAFGSRTVSCLIAAVPHDQSPEALADVLQEGALGMAPFELGIAPPLGPKQ